MEFIKNGMNQEKYRQIISWIHFPFALGIVIFARAICRVIPSYYIHLRLMVSVRIDARSNHGNLEMRKKYA
jgi:hypothetical protein